MSIVQQRAKMDVRSAGKADLAFFLELAKQEGWNPGIGDAQPFFAADPKGFFIGEVAGAPVAILSAVNYGKEFGFIGFYVVLPEYRGMGYGLQIWNHGLAHVKECKSVGLDAVLEQCATYQRSGFEIAYRETRYELTAKRLETAFRNVVDLSASDLEMIVDYDASIFGIKREQFIAKWISIDGGYAVAKLDDGGHLAGYGVIRPCVHGYKIGPLFANSLPIAKELCSTLLGHVKEGVAVFIDIPAVNKQALEWISETSVKSVFNVERMYRGKVFEQDLQRVFGVTSCELG